MNTVVSPSTAETQSLSFAACSVVADEYSTPLKLVISKNKSSTFSSAFVTFSGATTTTVLRGHLRLSFPVCLAALTKETHLKRISKSASTATSRNFTLGSGQLSRFTDSGND